MSTLSSGLSYRIILFLLVCIFATFRSHEPLKPWVIYYSFLHGTQWGFDYIILELIQSI